MNCSGPAARSVAAEPSTAPGRCRRSGRRRCRRDPDRRSADGRTRRRPRGSRRRCRDPIRGGRWLRGCSTRCGTSAPRLATRVPPPHSRRAPVKGCPCGRPCRPPGRVDQGGVAGCPRHTGRRGRGRRGLQRLVAAGSRDGHVRDDPVVAGRGHRSPRRLRIGERSADQPRSEPDEYGDRRTREPSAGTRAPGGSVTTRRHVPA